MVFSLIEMSLKEVVFLSLRKIYMKKINCLFCGDGSAIICKYLVLKIFSQDLFEDYPQGRSSERETSEDNNTDDANVNVLATQCRMIMK